MLVWTGDPATALPPMAHPTPPHAPTPPTPDAECRQLTVMFCDLADSTALSGQLDPEDYRAVVRAYQDTGATVIQRHGGSIAQYLGGALLVYFGWPQAHEDDAQRAVRAGLELVAAMGPLNARLAPVYGIRLAVRVGLHTGLVVVGTVGSGARLEHLALGEAPNVASRIQGLADRNTVALSAATARLVEGHFTLTEQGVYHLQGVTEPMQVWRVLGESGTQTRFEVVTQRGLTPLVGREEESAILWRHWQQSRAGQGQVVLLQGEGGIGKSRLAEDLRQHVVQEGAAYITMRFAVSHHQCARAGDRASAPLVRRVPAGDCRGLSEQVGTGAANVRSTPGRDRTAARRAAVGALAGALCTTASHPPAAAPADPGHAGHVAARGGSPSARAGAVGRSALG